MLNQFSRTELLLGNEAMKKLAGARVAVFGIGGVGGYTVEALVRSGLGAIDLIDDDKVCLTNINRQIFATRKTVGKYIVDVAAAKIALAVQAQSSKTPLISCMGAGNKLDPTRFEVADLYETSVCPLAKVMRRELKRRGVKKLKVVYSKEPPMTPIEDTSISCRENCSCPPGTVRKCTQRRQVPGSNAFVPSVAGLIIAGEVIKDLIR